MPFAYYNLSVNHYDPLAAINSIISQLILYVLAVAHMYNEIHITAALCFVIKHEYQ